MAAGVLGATFSLLALVSIIQGFQGGAMSHYEEEAVVGRSATLKCSIKKHAGLEIIGIEWRKKNIAKLAIYSSTYGKNLFQHNLTLQVENNDAIHTVFSYLHLPELRKGDSGTYICDITTFPLGSFRTEINLTIEDNITIECDVQKNVQVYSGQNVTIHCNTSLPNAQYRWTKNKSVVSSNGSLELRMVTEANAGTYALTVNAGEKTAHKEFIITVQQAATSSGTDISTVSSQRHANSTVRNLHTTMATSTNEPNVTNVTEALREPSTTSSASRSDIHRSLDTTTPSSDGTTTQEIMKTERELYKRHTEDSVSMTMEESSSLANFSEKPDAAPTALKGRPATVTKEMATVKKDTKRGHLLLVLIVIPVLLLMAVAGFIHRRRVIKMRMELPPPFKPPPPPVKYTAPRCQTSTQPLCT